jgi:hypothetical protein
MPESDECVSNGAAKFAGDKHFHFFSILNSGQPHFGHGPLLVFFSLQRLQ